MDQTDVKTWWDLITDKASWAFLGALSGIIGWVFIAGKKVQKFAGRIDTLEKDQTEIVTALAKITDDFKSRLYDGHGQNIFKTAESCAESSSRCQKRIDKKLDDLSGLVKELIKMHMEGHTKK